MRTSRLCPSDSKVHDCTVCASYEECSDSMSNMGDAIAVVAAWVTAVIAMLVIWRLW
jgi:hypothetical protein